MKHKSFGFTLIEVTLFLAVTGALFAGIIIGTQNSIRAQRYNDSVQSFANFWRDIYASVSNTQNVSKDNVGRVNGGRSEQAIYGKLVVFGETYDLNGEKNTSQKIFYYDVIGNVAKPGDNLGNTIDALKKVNANVLIVNEDDSTIYTSGLEDSYTPTWNATIEKDDPNASESFTGSILVVKHPRSTSISTYFSSKTINVNEILNGDDTHQVDDLLFDGTDFKTAQIDFCINSDDIGRSLLRRQDVRLVKNANNVSSIEIISSDNPGNPCTNSKGEA